MIQIKEFLDRQFETKEEMFKALADNKENIIAQKKMKTKEADAVVYVSEARNEKGETVKADTVDVSNVNRITSKLVINTTNVMDSHSDVHLKGIWTKSIKEQKNLYLLQEHKMRFDSIITDQVKATVQLMSWKDLGASYKGKTEALVFDAEIGKRNKFMFEQYAKGYVKNHSVGMRYVKIEMAINSEEKWSRDEKEVWDKYIDDIVNKEQAEAQGYFFAVSEAKIIEGSAVPIGSNTITPTLNIEAAKSTSKQEAEKSLQNSRKQFFINQM
jgi:hypothetical protein